MEDPGCVLEDDNPFPLQTVSGEDGGFTWTTAVEDPGCVLEDDNHPFPLQTVSGEDGGFT